MKLITITEDVLKLLNLICHHALKGSGIDALAPIKSLESWISTAVDQPPSESK